MLTTSQTVDRVTQLQKRSRRPLTPGQVVANLLEEYEMSQGELALRLGISRATVSRLINGHRVLSPDLAHRLGRFFNNGAAAWMQMQATVDIWDALHADGSAYTFIRPLEVPQAIEV